MALSPLTFRIAMLNADIPVPNVLSQRGSYGNIFHGLLTAAAKRIAPGLTIEAEDFDVVKGQYPESLAGFDALLITGSISSVYEDAPWCHTLDDYVMAVYKEHPRIKFFGSCFGHQMICQSLLRNHGVRVERDPNGWEVGVHEIRLEPAFVKALGGTGQQPLRPLAPRSEEYVPQSTTEVAPLETLRLQLVHADHVKVPDGQSLPEPWMPIGRSKQCAFQGAYEPGRVLTYQGHFEFNRFVNMETVKVFGEGWDPATIEAAIEAMDKDDDSQAAADIVMRFFMEGRSAVLGVGGLMTPPLE